MRALTLWQPWAWAIAAGHKRIENRAWQPPVDLLGHRLAIHAGKTFDKGGLYLLFDLLGRARVDECAIHATGIVAVATVVGCVADEHSLRQVGGYEDQVRWYSGPIGWMLADVVAINSVPCRGAQGLWPLAPEIEHLVVERAAMKGGG